MLRPDELAARTDWAVATATSVAEQLGLNVTKPRVLYDVFSVIVHLAPVRVIARVPTVLPPSYTTSPQTQTAQQRSELAVTAPSLDTWRATVPITETLTGSPWWCANNEVWPNG